MSRFGSGSVSGEADLSGGRRTAADFAAVLFDCVHSAKSEDLSRTTTAIFRERLARAVRVEVAGIEGAR
jgi:hypothetical protein